MKHIPNVVLIDMTHIIAKHALISIRERVQKYGYNEEEVLFGPYPGRMTDPDDPENMTNAKENNVELSFW